MATSSQETMDIEPNTNNIVEKSEPINMSTDKNNLDNVSKSKDNNKKPTLSNEDLNNFKNSISYVSKISIIFLPFINIIKT